MNQQADQRGTDRSNVRARFHTRLSRYRSLLRRRWWVPFLGAILGMAVQAALTRSERVSFSSVGRMIVSIKLNIAEGSVYTEELSNFLGTQASLMQSGVVINRAHKRAVEQLRQIKKNPELSMQAAVALQAKLAKIAPDDLLHPRPGSKAFPMVSDEMLWQLDFFASMVGDKTASS